VWRLDGLGDVLMVDVVKVGLVTKAGGSFGRVRLDGWAGLARPQLVLLSAYGVVDFADAVEDPGIGGEEVAAGLLSDFEFSAFAAEADQVPAKLVVMRPHGLLPGAVSLGDI
jgi:hypothetical protein